MSDATGCSAADVEDGIKPGHDRGEHAELREAKQADPAARAGERGPAPGGGVSVAGEPAGKMMYPLVRELAVDGIPVTVTCRVLKIARQPYYRWLASPVTDAELDEAYRANALFDAHRDDPEFGYRFLADEAREAGHGDGRADRVADLLGQRLVVGVRQEASAARTRKSRAAGPRRPRAPRLHRRRARTSCGWPTSPSTGPARASSTSARSRTSTPTGSSATRSTRG